MTPVVCCCLVLFHTPCYIITLELVFLEQPTAAARLLGPWVIALPAPEMAVFLLFELSSLFGYPWVKKAMVVVVFDKAVLYSSVTAHTQNMQLPSNSPTEANMQ